MHRRSFTLIEVVLMLLILGLITAFALPELGGEIRRRSLVESADRLKSLIVMCRARAMQDGKKYRISFPGTPDPLDRFADKEVDIPVITQQPNVERQNDPQANPEWWGGFDAEWKLGAVLQEGTRCVAVMPGRPHFEISPHRPIAGPSISEDRAEFVHLTFAPDGTTSWVTFVLTDIPPNVEPQDYNPSRILNVIVDGRTGETWVQRALRVEEVEVMQEYGASPILHVDFTRADMITEQNILEIHIRQGGELKIGRRRSAE